MKRKFSFGMAMLSLLKCVGYFAVYYIATTVATVIATLALMTKHTSSEIQALIQANLLPITLMTSAVFLLITAIYYNHSKRYDSFSHKMNLRPIRLGTMPYVLCLGICMLFFVNLVIGILPIPEEWLKAQSESTSAWAEDSSMLMKVLTVGIFAPITEEVLFRGLMLGTMRRHIGNIPAIIISAVAFGLVHGTPLAMAYAFVLGILMGWLFCKTNSMLTTVIFHMTYNITSLYGSFLSKEYVGMLCLMSVPISIACIVAISRIPPIPETKYNDKEE